MVDSARGAEREAALFLMDRAMDWDSGNLCSLLLASWVTLSKSLPVSVPPFSHL